MTGCLADSPRPVPMHVCFHSGFDCASLSAGSRQKKGAKDPPPWQLWAACLKQQASDQTWLEWAANPTACMRSLLCVCERERESVCLCEGGAPFTLLAPDACRSTSLTAINRCIWMNVISPSITHLHSCIPDQIYPAVTGCSLCVNALRAAILNFELMFFYPESAPSVTALPPLCVLVHSRWLR